ncbi:hypothetical protein ABZ922_00105 [Streptomyces shenzhenensis]|uniref:hypothetical protein n=1 Tax=Streptomyces shenzhenensis TaxID=943815 RepID=UPI0033D093A2
MRSSPSRLLAAGFRSVRGHARRLVLGVAAVLALVTMSTVPAAAYAPVGIVHTEQVEAGPYTVTVGFSEWPLRAMQSLDFTFVPEGGIARKSGVLAIDGPGLDEDDRKAPLARHPRKLDVWGLDVKALPEAGRYDFTFDIDGHAGHGRGTLRDVPVLEQPGPPLALSWTVCAIPPAGMFAYLAVGWRRSKPAGKVAALV